MANGEDLRNTDGASSVVRTVAAHGQQLRDHDRRLDEHERRITRNEDRLEPYSVLSTQIKVLDDDVKELKRELNESARNKTYVLFSVIMAILGLLALLVTSIGAFSSLAKAIH